MIYKQENSTFVTDAQWLALMEIVGERQMMLTMPEGENCPVDLMYDEVHYVIHPDGKSEIKRMFSSL